MGTGIATYAATNSFYAGNGFAAGYVNATAQTADVTINLTATSGIADNSYRSQVRLFPNPTRSSLTVQLPAEQRVQLTVSNEKGTILLQRQESGTEFLLDTINIAPGVYFLNIKSDFANNSYKFLVRK